MSDQSIADLRRDYAAHRLSKVDLDPDPIAQFRRWLDEAIAAELPEPTAMCLATCAADGQPSSRIVLLKSLDERGFGFYTNYDSRKGRELAGNPRAALSFFRRSSSGRFSSPGWSPKCRLKPRSSIFTPDRGRASLAHLRLHRAQLCPIVPRWKRRSPKRPRIWKASRCRCPTRGADSSCSRPRSSSGKGVAAVCTIVSATGTMGRGGKSTDSHPNPGVHVRLSDTFVPSLIAIWVNFSGGTSSN